MKCWIWVTVAIMIPLFSAVADEPKPENDVVVQPKADGPETAPAEEASHCVHLECLEWMVGTWEAQDSEGTVTTTCRWTKNHNFLTRTFKIVTNDKRELEGTQVIGWDPIRKQIRSWIFDSEGGFGEGWWSRDGKRWIAKTSHVLAGGKRAAAMDVMTEVDSDTLTWQSISRELDGEMIPNGPEITLVRVKADK